MLKSIRHHKWKKLRFMAMVFFAFLLFLPLSYAEDGGEMSEEQKTARRYYDLGVFAYEDGDYKAAAENFQKALNTVPDDPRFLHYLGKVYLKTEQYEDAARFLNAAWEKDKSLPDLKYDVAVLGSKTGDYEKAAILFREIVQEDPANILAHYHAGISLYHLKRYEEAIAYLEYAAKQSSAMQLNAWYYAGVCYWRTGDMESAVSNFQYVEQHADTEELKGNASKWLALAEKPEQKEAGKPYDLYMEYSFQHDDNVPLEPGESDRFSDAEDFLLEFFASGNYNFISRPNYKAGAGYSFYQTLHAGLSEYDLTGNIFSLYFTYRINPFQLGFSYIPAYYWLDFDSYLRRHQFRPEVTWKMRKDLFARFACSFYDNEYFQDESRSGHSNEMSGDLYYTLPEKKGWLSCGAAYEMNSASEEEDYSQWQTKAGAVLQMPWEMSLGVNLKYSAKTYDNENSLYGEKREDDKYSFSLSVSRQIVARHLGVRAEYEYTKNDSNIADYEYDRNLIGLSLTANF